jgi:2-polyprenyl-3-methyl-5-hydroxy-6-metoxy-1,4-benzoquinol methylase
MYLEYTGLFSQVRQRYFSKVIRQMQANGCTRLLDYGCGPGDVLEVCRKLHLPAVGLDSSYRSFQLATQRGFRVLHGDESSAVLSDEKFDAVFMQSVIEHLADAVGILEKLVAMLPPGGLLFVSAPTPCSDFWDDPTHVRPFTPKSFRILADLLSLDVLEINYVFSYLLNVKLESSLWYKLLNRFPMPLGSNLVGLYRKPRQPKADS